MFIINFIDYLKEVRDKIYKNMGEVGMAAIVECRTPQYSPFSIFSDIYNFMDLAKPLKPVWIHSNNFTKRRATSQRS